MPSFQEFLDSLTPKQDPEWLTNMQARGDAAAEDLRNRYLPKVAQATAPEPAAGPPATNMADSLASRSGYDDAVLETAEEKLTDPNFDAYASRMEANDNGNDPGGAAVATDADYGEEGAELGTGGKALALGPALAGGVVTPNPNLPTAAPLPATQPAGNAQSLLDRFAFDPAEMKAAQAAASDNRLAAGLARAGTQLGHALSRSKDKIDLSGADVLDKNANSPVEDVKAANEARKASLENQKTEGVVQDLKNSLNPASDKSQTAREFARKSGHPVSDSASYADIEKILPMYQKQDLAHAVKQANEIKRNEQQAQKIDKEYIEAGKALAFTKAAGAANQAVKSKLFAANRLDQLLEQYPDGNLPKIPTRELATGVAAMLSAGSGSQTAVSAINEIEPHSVVGNINDAISWLTNNPTGRGQQKFIEQFATTIRNEKKTAENQLRAEAAKQASAMSDSLGRGPNRERFEEALLKPNGLDWSDIESARSGKEMDLKTGKWHAKGDKPKGAMEALSHKGDTNASRKAPTTTAAKSYGADVMKYAKEHGISEAEAQGIKDKRMTK